MDSHCQLSHARPFCQVRGRMITKHDLQQKITNLCDFHRVRYDSRFVRKIDADQALHSQLAAVKDLCDSLISRDFAAILLLEANLPYESSWGGFSCIPNSVLNISRKKPLAQSTPSGFIEPYLDQYRIACRAVRLGCDASGKECIAIPDYLIDAGKDNKFNNRQLLFLDLEQMAARDSSGSLSPPSTWHGSCRTYALSEDGVRRFTEAGFIWMQDRMVPVGDHLPAEVIRCRPAGGDGPVAEALSPKMPMIITDRTPQLRASEILLQHQFSALVKELHEREHCPGSRIFCIAGLRIDMSTLGRKQTDHFIPWKAYLRRARHDHDEGPFGQEELFAELMGPKWQIGAVSESAADQ